VNKKGGNCSCLFVEDLRIFAVGLLAGLNINVSVYL